MSAHRKIEPQVIALIQRLPPLPESVDRLLERVTGRQPDTQEILSVVEQDPSLCMELLHLADSCFGRPGCARSIREALELVGPVALAQMAALSCADDTIREQFAGLEHLPEYFAHSREIEASCLLLGEVLSLSPQDCALYGLAGLIHDIGRLIILMASDRRSARLMGTSWEQMATIVQSEQELLGMNHCEVGMQLCRKWGFADILQEGVLRHHTPQLGSDISTPGILIFVAHFVAASDFTGEILAKMLRPQVFSGLGLTRELFDRARALYGSRFGAGS
jgi:HD-like signal output (HDOD) protein